jgi:hypothetical protein
VRIVLLLFVLSFSLIYALRRGGEPERAVAIIFILMIISDPLVHVVTPKKFTVLDPGHFIIDLIGWIALLGVALRAHRFWPLWVSALQTISLIAHISKLLDYSIHPVAYGIMQVAGSYPLLIILTIGTYNHQARLHRNGSDIPWNA